MQNKLQILLDQINLDEQSRVFFDGAKLDKIIGNKTRDSYKFLITLIDNIPLDIYQNFND